MMNEPQFNNKLGRAIRLMEGSYRSREDELYFIYKVDDDPLNGYHKVASDVSRKLAFDWLKGKGEYEKPTRDEKLEAVIKKVQADVELIIETCRTNDGWLDHLYGDRNRTLSITPHQH